MTDEQPRTEEGFRRDEAGNPLWHAPLPDPDFDPHRPYHPNNSPFSTCQRCGEAWPCAEARYDSGPIAVGGIWLRNQHDGTLQVLAEIDGVWRIVIEQPPGDIISNIVEPLGIRHSRRDDR